MLFPLVALFHILLLLWTSWSDRTSPFPGMEWLEVLWMAGYTFFWLAVCDLRKWGLFGYVLITFADILLFLAVRNKWISATDCYSNLRGIDAIFSVILLFFYKRFR